MGDAENFWAAWEANQQWLYRFIYTAIRNHHDTEDLLHEVALQGLVSWSKIRDVKKAHTWIKSIAIHVIAGHYRRIARVELCDLETLDRHMSHYDGINIDKMVIYQFLDGLPADWRWVMILNLYYEVSAREIAQITGRSFFAVRQRITRTKKLLAASLCDAERVVSTSEAR